MKTELVINLGGCSNAMVLTGDEIMAHCIERTDSDDTTRTHHVRLTRNLIEMQSVVHTDAGPKTTTLSLHEGVTTITCGGQKIEFSEAVIEKLMQLVNSI